jgi:hypothetical protein
MRLDHTFVFYPDTGVLCCSHQSVFQKVNGYSGIFPSCIDLYECIFSDIQSVVVVCIAPDLTIVLVRTKLVQLLAFVRLNR